MYSQGVTAARQREYEVRLEPQPEGGFTVFVPELPDVITEGDTREEALVMAKDAIDGYLETMREQGWGVRRTETSRVTAAARMTNSPQSHLKS
ncbi:MAG: type II toxin-antitoxin system HicB family antitoxin [Mycobacteriales bacterium]